MKILLINEGLSDNIGDKCIKYTLVNQLNKRNIEVDFCDFSKIKEEEKYIKYNEKDKLYTYKTVKRKSKLLVNIILLVKSLMWFIKNFKKCDEIITSSKYEAVIIGGGQLLLNKCIFPVIMYTWIISAKKNGIKKIVLFSVGCGRNFNFYENILLKYSLKKVDKIFVRDKESYINVKNNFNIESNLTYDCVFTISDLIKMNTISNQVTLLGIIDYNTYYIQNENPLTREEYYNYWLNIIKNSKETFKFIYTTESDLIETIRFKNYVNKYIKYEIEIVKTSTVKELCNTISSANKVISGRMHALIIAISYGKEIKAFRMNDKLKGFEVEFIENNINIEFIKSKVNNDINKVLNIILN